MEDGNIGRAKQAQRTWTDRGLSSEQAGKLEAKIGVLKGAVGERFIRALKVNPELAKKYAEAVENNPEKFIDTLIKNFQAGSTGLRLKTLQDLKRS